MSKTRILLLTALVTGFASFQTLKATSIDTAECVIANDTALFKKRAVSTEDTLCVTVTPGESGTTAEIPSTDNLPKKRVVCALFALPFPCGFVGAHRVMLGTKPWVPIVYVATFGGCFGLLPLIDFCFITFSKDLTSYENNPHVFMWAK